MIRRKKVNLDPEGTQSTKQIIKKENQGYLADKMHKKAMKRKEAERQGKVLVNWKIWVKLDFRN